jgi:nucleotide-binding universal stress UspA family protein
MYKTILIPLENSPADDTILAHVQSLARVLGARLVLVHVADGYVARNQQQLNLEDSEEIQKDRAYLERRRSELVKAGFTATTHLALGDPTTEILALAEKEKCDLIAMATHGHRFIADAILGSVASQIRHRTDIPVLMVRARHAGPAANP